MVLAAKRLAYMLEQVYGQDEMDIDYDESEWPSLGEPSKKKRKVNHILVLKEKVAQFFNSFFA